MSYPGSPAPGGAYGTALYAPPAEALGADDERAAFGDEALEHLRMVRGRFTAWPYVVIAYLLESALIGCAVGLPAGLALAAATGSREAFAAAAVAAGAPIGLGGAYLVFRGRWRTIEAYSSRFCVGIMNISLFFVPLVALVYANVRGVRKLSGT